MSEPAELIATVNPTIDRMNEIIGEGRDRGASNNAIACIIANEVIVPLVASLTRERDMIAAVNADWSAYDKGVREAGKALLKSEWDRQTVNGGVQLARVNAIALDALRSVLSLVPESKDNGS